MSIEERIDEIEKEISYDDVGFGDYTHISKEDLEFLINKNRSMYNDIKLVLESNLSPEEIYAILSKQL